MSDSTLEYCQRHRDGTHSFIFIPHLQRDMICQHCLYWVSKPELDEFAKRYYEKGELKEERKEDEEVSYISFSNSQLKENEPLEEFLERTFKEGKEEGK